MPLRRTFVARALGRMRLKEQPGSYLILSRNCHVIHPSGLLAPPFNGLRIEAVHHQFWDLKRQLRHGCLSDLQVSRPALNTWSHLPP